MAKQIHTQTQQLQHATTKNTSKLSTNKDGLPYGTGSIHLRARNLWLIYRNAEGMPIQESAHTLDKDEARRILAKKAIATLQARIKALKAVINEPIEGVGPATSVKGSRRG